ncbi:MULTISPECIES: PAS domain-containing protein [Leptolyngbya]|uniref:PAS domain-containing protein n=1 Tax=Leptolyngbya TaxID=47251 RepID=UPI00168A21B7|nr:PAS domain-containing protein [Leptolyngbya sp. FACHB-1624]MBD1858671.1 PAS domain-containing protein [Leptolyngbya sp. FACHB-1624]
MTQPSRTVLIVNNSPEDCQLYQCYLQRDSDYSYTILETSSGRQGLELWQQQRPDLVLLNYRLPDLDGLEFLAQLPSLTSQPCLPVVVIADQGNEMSAVQAMKAGAQDYLIQGQITPERLHLTIHRAIETVQLRTELQSRIEQERIVNLCQAELAQQSQTDLAERYRVEAVLRESKEQLRSALTASRMGTWDWNIQTGHIQWSDNLEAMFGIEPGAFDGSFEMFASFLHPADRDRVLAEIERVIATGEDYNIEFQVVYPDSTIRWALSQGKVFYNSQGQPLRMAGNDIDITERKRAEASLRESEQRYATLSQISPVGIFHTDIHGDCLYTNARWCELAGLIPETAQGKGWLRALHPDDRDRVFAEWYRATELNQPFYSEYRFQAPDGKVSWVLGQVTAEQDSEGHLIGYVGTVTDISDRKQVENALQESELRFRQLAENIDVVFWIKEVAGDRVSYVSPAYERLWGLDPQKLYESQQSWIDYIHPDDREVTDRAFHEKSPLGQFDQEYRIVLPDGRTRWVRDRCFPLHNQLGEIYRFTGIAEDITDRKRSEQALRESEERFRTSVENMLDCFAIYQAIRNEQGEIVDFRTEYVNDAACLNNQMTREQQIGRGLCELLPRHRDSGLFDEYCQVVETGQPLVKDSLIYEDDYGQRRLIRAFDIRVAKLGDGYIATWRDITERKQIEEALRDNEQLLRLALTGAQAGSWDWEIPTGKVTWSPENYVLYGIDPATTFPSYETWYNTLHPDDRESTKAEVLRIIEEKLPGFRAEFRIVHPQRGILWLLGLGQLTLDEQGEPLRLSGINLDITERKQSEIERGRLLEQEQAARESAELANRIKDEFLAVLSHELRSPLNPILGWTKLMQSRKFDTTRTNAALATIERNAKLQTQLIDDLLDVAKILRGKLSMNVAPVDLIFVIEAAIDTVRTAAVAKEITLHAVLPQIGQVSGDAARLQQIVWNLLSNAIKFTPTSGRVDIRLERIDHQAQITVSDTGKGINPAFLPHIFESFRQEDASTTRKYGGLGLGLAIVRSLVEAHGGTITADSLGEGQGATFSVRFPILDIEPEVQLSELNPVPDLDLTGVRVLAVDDELDARELLAMVLTMYGAEVLTVTSAAEALIALESFQPDILVSDIGMPEVDGHGLIQQIRALPPEQGGQIPAIALTAYAREEDHQRAITSGFQQQVTKPLEPERLVQVIVTLVRGSG